MSENKILYSDVNLSQDVKRAGKGSVDVANGRLSFVHEDVSIPFGKSSFTLSHGLRRLKRQVALQRGRIYRGRGRL